MTSTMIGTQIAYIILVFVGESLPSAESRTRLVESPVGSELSATPRNAPLEHGASMTPDLQNHDSEPKPDPASTLVCLAAIENDAVEALRTFGISAVLGLILPRKNKGQTWEPS
jgi:hypothetical protein